MPFMILRIATDRSLLLVREHGEGVPEKFLLFDLRGKNPFRLVNRLRARELVLVEDGRGFSDLPHSEFVDWQQLLDWFCREVERPGNLAEAVCRYLERADTAPVFSAASAGRSR